MNRFIKKTACCLLSAVVSITMLPAVLTAKAYQETGQRDGYDWELWNQDGKGTVNMSVGDNGSFTCSWNGIENCLFRTGQKLGSTKTYHKYDGIYLDYDVDYFPKGNSYMCVYGWTENGSGTYPTVEYYIVDAWGSWRPPGANNSLGTVEANGHKYDIYRTERINQPSIHGTETFYQYWSVRQDNPARNNAETNISGRISISKHFEEWEKVGMDMSGVMYEVALNVEGYQSSGSAKVNSNIVTYGEGHGDEGAVIKPVEPVEPDSNGYYFNDSFESSTGDWSGRGSASVELNNGSLAVTGRTESWNGAITYLDPAAFIAGETYSFGVKAMQNETASENFKLTLQCTLDGEEQYLTVAEGTGVKGEWVNLINSSYTIPEGALNCYLYVETVDSNTNFFMDDAAGALKGVITETEDEIPDTTDFTAGDLNDDGIIDSIDVVLERKALLSTFAGSATSKAADVDGNGTVNVNDLVILSKFITRKTDKFPQAETPVTTTTTINETEKITSTTTNNSSQGGNADGAAYMESLRNSITPDVPANITNNSDNGCKEEKISYYSTIAKKNKNAVVILPPNYSTSKKYPVVYVNHGIFGTENDMVGYCKSIGGNLMASGEAEEMILVSCFMYTSATSDQCQGMTAEECEKYDAFREDLIECLMPYMEEHYSVATGRENTGICGFSMGGRESLYIGITRPQYFGYIGAAAPAPGITPASDMFTTHPGNMQPSEFKVQDHTYDPYFLMITGGTNDTVVGTFPKQYHETLTTNGQPHIWQEIQGGGHDASCINPLMYNFLKNAFKANK